MISVLPNTGVLRGIALRQTDGQPMIETRSCTLVIGGGISEENRRSIRRGITFLSLESWRETCAELQVDLPWHARRANFLVEGLDLSQTPGRTLHIGIVSVRIHGETKPCGIMDARHQGLRKALEPRFRGGVFGEILQGGEVSIGDPIQFESVPTTATEG